jgi:hypothetical protein
VVGNSPTDDDYDHITDADFESPDREVQSSNDFVDVSVKSGFGEEGWEEVNGNTPHDVQG